MRRETYNKRLTIQVIGVMMTNKQVGSDEDVHGNVKSGMFTTNSVKLQKFIAEN